MKTKALIAIMAICFLASCEKKENPDPPKNPDTYVNTNTGSTWTYHEDNSSGATPVSSDYTITSTAKDTTIGSRKYHVYSYSYGGSQYLSLSGHEYYQFDSIPISGGPVLERLYLKDDVAKGASWSQDVNLTIPNFPIPISVKITNNIAEKGIARTVNGIDYTNVTHVTTSISSTAIPSSGLTSSIDSYFAPKYGLIENTTKINLDYLGFTEKVDIKTQLVNSILK